MPSSAVGVEGAAGGGAGGGAGGEVGERAPKRPLPAAINLGYANWGECDTKVSTAAASGVNVIVWFALSLMVDAGGMPQITGGPNLTCVGQLAAMLEARGLPTHHVISIGGWNGAHPSAKVSPAAWWKALRSYDAQADAAGLAGGFDGIDWDLEGNDNRSAKRNLFPADELRGVARISELAKADGKLVFMVPPQSYLNSETEEFALDVIRPATCWHPEFLYAGRNVYAALLALAAPGTFDLVSLQLYESWSVTNCMISPQAYGGRGMELASYLDRLVQTMSAGWRVDFELEPSLGLRNQTVVVPATRLLLGLANGWACSGHSSPPCKALFVEPGRLKTAWSKLSTRPRGLFFWDIGDEGKPFGTSRTPLYLADAFNDILHTRS